MPRGRLVAILFGAGLVVGGAVAVMASVTGTAICGARRAGDACYELTRTLSVRVGLLAGVMAMIMVLVVVGLVRMLSQDGRQRAEKAMEAYLSERERGPASEGDDLGE